MATHLPAIARAAAGSHDRSAAALRALGRAAVAVLVVFHAWLLGLHLLEGRVFEPGTAIRWGLAVLILLGFRALGRRSLPLFAGRRAVVLWLLVVIIHCSAALDGSAAPLQVGVPETVTGLAQAAAVVAVLGVVVGAALASAVRSCAGGRAAFPVHHLVAGLPSTGVVLCFSPRPPPRA